MMFNLKNSSHMISQMWRRISQSCLFFRCATFHSSHPKEAIFISDLGHHLFRLWLRISVAKPLSKLISVILSRSAVTVSSIYCWIYRNMRVVILVTKSMFRQRLSRQLCLIWEKYSFYCKNKPTACKLIDFQDFYILEWTILDNAMLSKLEHSLSVLQLT